MAEKVYGGGCHCRRVRYEVKTALSPVISCNCSHCQPKGLLLTFVPAEQFRLISGEGDMTLYQFNRKVIEHLFCKTCGVESFARGRNASGAETVSINVRCLDDIDLSSLQITPFDGRSR
jgi:hypothetical protein